MTFLGCGRVSRPSKHFQEKWNPVFHPEMRQNKKIGWRKSP
ncbi:hypothetical protein SZ54_0285 [Rhizobium sp. UR51a]|nr:hypothetical protein SZ54_0285 [Rhizobium sp. UR51a]